MPIWTNPFTRNDRAEFLGVVIPLSQATRFNQLNIDHAPPSDEKDAGIAIPKDDNNKLDRIGSEENGAASNPECSHQTIEAIRAEVESEIAASGHDSSYDLFPAACNMPFAPDDTIFARFVVLIFDLLLCALKKTGKATTINLAIQDIGMGRYQWQLFILCGFGWFADNLWLQGIALTLNQVSQEFGISSTHVRFTTAALFIGLCIGASFWGIASDIVGRRLAFNMTLLICGIFGICIGASPTWIGVCGMAASLGLGVGGNLPVDGALFLEFLPTASNYLLTLLSIWWPMGQLVGSLIAWGFLPNYSCDTTLKACSAVAAGEPCCRREDNMGWRYLCITMGALTIFMWACRFFLFHLYESPKFLLSRGRQEEAVRTVHAIAFKNKAHTWLTVDILNEIGGHPDEVGKPSLSVVDIIKRALSKFSGERIGPLFASKKLGLTTALLWFCWATIGMGFPLFNAFLPQYLAHAGSSGGSTSPSITYRNYAITSIVGVPGSILGCYTVNLKYIGRKGTMAISTLITGVILFCFTISSDPNAQLTCSSLEAFFQNIMYGVLYAYTPEVFPAPNRGTGAGISSFFNRLCGVMAPIVAIYGTSSNPNAPVYASGGLMLAAFVAMVLLPIETRGKQCL
ncbi:putative sugar transporter [Talaromyces proteolyticus]|uniref:Sugar transporter n=1 Tax=Talaromyces proteolyticus TaxID=1131652 RepID=A0AAD4KLE8_9EURO|nr:putative sugar transporter [Talaromyces proteolyticus]KAH8693816.1 putative sugar transporter [Talaromyces proteolyticus]